jgi:nitrogenase molybdenum-iron protein NifN
LLGGYQRLWVGYRGTRQALFDLANMLVEHGHHETAPYVSIYQRDSKSPLSNSLPQAGERTNVKSDIEFHATPAAGQTH